MNTFHTPRLLEARARLLRITALLAERRGERGFAAALRAIAYRLEVRAEARRLLAEAITVAASKHAA